MIKQHVCTKSKNTHDFELVVGLLIETDSLDNHLGNLQEFIFKKIKKRVKHLYFSIITE